MMICSFKFVVFHLEALLHKDAHQGEKPFSQYTMPFCDMLIVTIILTKVYRPPVIYNACNLQPFLGLHQNMVLYLTMLVLLLLVSIIVKLAIAR